MVICVCLALWVCVTMWLCILHMHIPNLLVLLELGDVNCTSGCGVM